ncbi:hypothetical protein ACWIUD_00800 [Helicobacter sp. 23-1044]
MKNPVIVRRIADSPKQSTNETCESKVNRGLCANLNVKFIDSLLGY